MNLSDRDIASSSEYGMFNGHLMEKDVLPKSCPKLKTFLLATHSRLGDFAYQKSLSKPASHGTSKNPNKKKKFLHFTPTHWILGNRLLNLQVSITQTSNKPNFTKTFAPWISRPHLHVQAHVWHVARTWPPVVCDVTIR